MAGKRKAKRNAVQLEDLSKPTQWRQQHGDFSPPSHDTDPETGVVVTHHRSVDTLGMMLANGTITEEMHDAGVLFRALFRRAALDSMSRSAFVRMPGNTVHAISDDQVEARRRIAKAIDMLGGHDSAAGSCAWHVLGCERSVREWAQRFGWSGRTMVPSTAVGVLVAVLAVLGRHFGLLPQPRAA